MGKVKEARDSLAEGENKRKASARCVATPQVLTEVSSDFVLLSIKHRCRLCLGIGWEEGTWMDPMWDLSRHRAQRNLCPALSTNSVGALVDTLDGLRKNVAVGSTLHFSRE